MNIFGHTTRDVRTVDVNAALVVRVCVGFRSIAASAVSSTGGARFVVSKLGAP